MLPPTSTGTVPPPFHPWECRPGHPPDDVLPWLLGSRPGLRQRPSLAQPVGGAFFILRYQLSNLWLSAHKVCATEQCLPPWSCFCTLLVVGSGTFCPRLPQLIEHKRKAAMSFTKVFNLVLNLAKFLIPSLWEATTGFWRLFPSPHALCRSQPSFWPNPWSFARSVNAVARLGIDAWSFFNVPPTILLRYLHTVEFSLWERCAECGWPEIQSWHLQVKDNLLRRWSFTTNHSRQCQPRRASCLSFVGQPHTFQAGWANVLVIPGILHFLDWQGDVWNPL